MLQRRIMFQDLRADEQRVRRSRPVASMAASPSCLLGRPFSRRSVPPAVSQTPKWIYSPFPRNALNLVSASSTDASSWDDSSSKLTARVMGFCFNVLPGSLTQTYRVDSHEQAIASPSASDFGGSPRRSLTWRAVRREAGFIAAGLRVRASLRPPCPSHLFASTSRNPKPEHERMLEEHVFDFRLADASRAGAKLPCASPRPMMACST